jgi:hypothetical protein
MLRRSVLALRMRDSQDGNAPGFTSTLAQQSDGGSRRRISSRRQSVETNVGDGRGPAGINGAIVRFFPKFARSRRSPILPSPEWFNNDWLPQDRELPKAPHSALRSQSRSSTPRLARTP